MQQSVHLGNQYSRGAHLHLAVLHLYSNISSISAFSKSRALERTLYGAQWAGRVFPDDNSIWFLLMLSRPKWPYHKDSNPVIVSENLWWWAWVWCPDRLRFADHATLVQRFDVLFQRVSQFTDGHAPPLGPVQNSFHLSVLILGWVQVTWYILAILFL